MKVVDTLPDMAKFGAISSSMRVDLLLDLRSIAPGEAHARARSGADGENAHIKLPNRTSGSGEPHSSGGGAPGQVTWSNPAPVRW